MPATVDEYRSRYGRPGVVRRLTPDREGEPPTRAQHAPGLAQSERGILHEHVTPATQHAIDAFRIELDAFGIKHLILDVRQPQRGATRARDRDHLRREVRTDQPPRVADQARRREASIARAGRKL